MDLLKWAGAQIRADEPVSARRSRNRISGVFLGIGSFLSFLVLVLVPGWHIAHPTAVAILAGSLVIASLLQIATAATVPIAANHAATTAGTIAIAVAQCLVGDPQAVATLGLMYVWIAICAALYYSLYATAIHVSVLVATQIVVLIVLFHAALVPQVILTAGTSITVAVVVGMLVRNMRRQTVTDPLTRLLNRRGLSGVFDTEIAIARRTRQPLAVAILDLDGFKELNDLHGHAAGDATLVEAAAMWTAALRAGDVLARLGGDEFAVVMPDCDSLEAADVIDSLLRATPPAVGCSAGIAVFDGDEDRHALLSRADKALYQAKTCGGNGFSIDADPVVPAA